MNAPPAQQTSVAAVDCDQSSGGLDGLWSRVARSALLGWLRPGRDLVRTPVPPISDLVRGIEGDQLHLVYQPKLRLRSRRIVSVEGLIRWQHPTHGLILPSEFIPAAEKSGDITALSRWVLDQSITDQRRLANQSYDMPVFINIAAALLANDTFIADACTKVVSSGASIGFEITETSVILDPDAAIANLKGIAALGIPIAIDDYGAGLSSLAYLKQLPACELKIDKLFITELTSSHRDPLIVRSTIDLAHAMEMEVVAEGVEDEAALALLSVMGCDMAQGYHISRPVEMDKLLSFLDRYKQGWAAQSDCSSLARLTYALKRA